MMTFPNRLFAMLAASLAVTTLAACASIPKRDSSAELLARYSAYAGAPVNEFRVYSPFDSWSSIDDEHVLVQTNVNDAYLLKLAPPCFDLTHATTVALTSRFPHTVQSGFDSLRVGRERCRILEIRPVDYRELRADLAQDKLERG